MSETVQRLIEHYGLIAVFLGCMAEGETAAILSGFFAHQRTFVPWQALATVWLGTFVGDTLLFLLGQRFSGSAQVARLRHRPGFERAFRLVSARPALFVMINRYLYGMRVAGGIAAGLSGVALPRFLVLNAVSALVWAAIFCGIGFVFGAGAERIVGQALQHHQRQLIGLGIGVATLVAVLALGRRLAGRAARERR